MDLTLSEIIILIEALEAEFAIAQSADDRPRLQELEAAFQSLRVLRARATIRELVDPLAQGLQQGTAAVAATVQRLTDPRTILTLRNLSDRTGIGIPVGPASGGSRSFSPENLPDRAPVEVLDTPDPAPAGGPTRFITARRTAQMTVVYTDDAGREFMRIGGSRSWRNFNPGNIRKGNFSDANGAIGDDGSFAIFPDKPTGSGAIERLLRGASYAPLTIAAGINRYAPPVENDTRRYLEFVLENTGLRADALLGELPIADLRKIVRAIEAMEGWKEGEERVHRPSSGQVAGAGGTSAGGVATGTSSGVGAAAEWMDVARTEEARGVSEIAGSQHNPRILEYFRVAASWFEPGGDETDWCAAFVNFCLETSGHVGTSHPGARSFFWNKQRQFVSLPGPRRFAIAVRRNAPFDDPRWLTGTGHVGFIVDHDTTHLTLLGGNQGRQVREARFPRIVRNTAGNVTSEFIAFMMPVMD